jgi:predicted acyltransferase
MRRAQAPVADNPRSALRPEAPTEPASRRLVSLDAFRGLTILGMLIVNNVARGDATPRLLTHAGWSGDVHLADLVFPWFLLIVGVAIPYAMASHRRKGFSGGAYALKAWGRAAVLVLLGCLIDSSLARRPLFGLGVLQLIGLAYLIASLLYALPRGVRLAVAGALLAAHWAAIRFIPVPGVGAGVFTADANLIRYLNEVYLQPYSLQGLLSVVPTSALVLIGTAVGDTLRLEPTTPVGKVTRLMAAGSFLAAIGWLWSLDLPFNKIVWSAPYVLYAGGIGTALLGFLYLLIDVRGWRVWAFPLVIFGVNAIFAYVAPILVKIHLLQEWKWPMADGSLVTLQQALLHFSITHAGRIAGEWLYTACYILVWWLVLFALYRKQIFLRV